MKKLILLFSLFTFLFSLLSSLQAQNPDIKRTMHWYFGDHAGIDFSSGTAIADTNGQINVLEGCSSISDTAGNLLFYTDGITVWNKIHQIMPNGTNLMATGTPRQSSIIIPKPNDEGNEDIYYIFTIDGFEYAGAKGLRYSEVDMTLNGRMGDVTQKNILLFDPNAEILAAVKHVNCRDVWLMAHERYNNCFRAYLITGSGISSTPVINCIGGAGPDSPFGYIAKFSPDGTKMITSVPGTNWEDTITGESFYGKYTFELYHFDNATGLLSDKIVLSADTFFAGACFSPDNSKLYVTTLNYEDQWAYQYDLSIWDSTFIQNSKTVITYDNQGLDDFQITPDKKIMVARIAKYFVAVINNPNLSGLACNYIQNGLYLNGKQCLVGLPNFIDSYFDTENCYTGIENIIENNNMISVYPNPFNSSATINIPPEIKLNEAKMFLYNITGKEVQSEIINENSFQVKRQNLPEGIYMLKLQLNNQIYKVKLLITN